MGTTTVLGLILQANAACTLGYYLRTFVTYGRHFVLTEKVFELLEEAEGHSAEATIQLESEDATSTLLEIDLAMQALLQAKKILEIK